MPPPADPIRSPQTPSIRRRSAEPLRRKQALPAASAFRGRKALNLLLVFVTIVLFVDALVGDKGLMETTRVRNRSRDLAVAVGRLQAENARLSEMARRLEDDPMTIESIARRELGLVRPGEVLFILKDVKPAR
jgi:cell division protein FtsB